MPSRSLPSVQPARPAVAAVRVWDLPTRLFHWSLAASVSIALLSGEEDSALAAWHHPAGWAVVALLVFRLIWGVAGGEHARFANFVRPGAIGAHLGAMRRRDGASHAGHDPLGGLAVLGLLGLAGLASGTGVWLLSGGNEELHELFAYALLALVAVHVAAVVIMSLLTHDNLIGAMITGRKSRARHPDAADARPGRPLALAVAVAAMALTAVVATRIDPALLNPAARGEAGEAGEHGAGDHEGGEEQED